jgi:Kef-type K+ transport system membrane component KefB
LGIVVSIIDNNLLALSVFIFLIITFLFSRQILTPIINKVKDEQNEEKFKKLHRFSVIINFIQMIFCIGLLVNLLR